MALWEEPPTAEPWDGPAVPDESGVDENDYLLAVDEMLYGTSFVDVTGKRIDPKRITTDPPEPNGEED